MNKIKNITKKKQFELKRKIDPFYNFLSEILISRWIVRHLNTTPQQSKQEESNGDARTQEKFGREIRGNFRTLFTGFLSKL